MITDLWVSFNYGGWTISFSKKFNLPFPPFYGLSIDDSTEDYENDIELATHDYCSTLISYSIQKEEFSVDVRNVWRDPVSDETIDDILKTFTNTEWERHDTTDIDSLKELMSRKRI